jgi:hypothetical protein
VVWPWVCSRLFIVGHRRFETKGCDAATNHDQPRQAHDEDEDRRSHGSTSAAQMTAMTGAAARNRAMEARIFMLPRLFVAGQRALRSPSYDVEAGMPV